MPWWRGRWQGNNGCGAGGNGVGTTADPSITVVGQERGPKAPTGWVSGDVGELGRLVGRNSNAMTASAEFFGILFWMC